MTEKTNIARSVFISHSNNSRSLIDHAHATDELHGALEDCIQKLASFFWDKNHYSNSVLKAEILTIFDGIKAILSDRHFRETINNYHSHHFDLEYQTECKFLIKQIKKIVGYIQVYKQLVVEASMKGTEEEEYAETLVENFSVELKNIHEYILHIMDKCRKRNDSYSQVQAPLPEDRIQEFTPAVDMPYFRNAPTWFNDHAPRPHHSLGLEVPQVLPPDCDITCFQGGRELFDRKILYRKDQLAQPKYHYRVERDYVKVKERQTKKCEERKNLIVRER